MIITRRPFLDVCCPGIRQLRIFFTILKVALSELNSLLFEEVASSNVQCLAIEYGAIPSNNKSVANVYLNSCTRYELYPYKAPGGHNSAYGNYFLAQQVFSILTNEYFMKYKKIETKDINYKIYDRSHVNEPFYGYEKCFFELNNLDQGTFINIFLPWELKDSPQWDIAMLDERYLNKNQVHSLVAIKHEKASIMDACFIPLEQSITQNMRVEIMLGNNYILLGTVKLIDENTNIGIVNLESNFVVDRNQKSLYMHNSDYISYLKLPPKIVITINRRPVLKGLFKTKINSYELKPVKNDFVLIGKNGGSFIAPDKLHEDGLIYLVLIKNKKVKKVPFAKWSIKLEQIEIAGAGVSKPIKKLYK